MGILTSLPHFLARLFLAEINGEMKKKCRLSGNAMEELAAHPLPGNARDLKRIIRELVRAARPDATIAAIYSGHEPPAELSADEAERRKVLQVLSENEFEQALAKDAWKGGATKTGFNILVQKHGLTYKALLKKEWKR